MRIDLRYTTKAGDKHEVCADFLTICQWEEWSGRQATSFADGVGMRDLAYLAWKASMAADVVVAADLNKFISTIDDLEVLGEATERPTAAPDGA